MARSTAREVAMQLVYERMMGGVGGELTREQLIAVPLEAEDYGFVEDLLSGVSAHQQQIDALIEKHAVGWTLKRLSRVDLATLRVATYELMAREDIPPAATINEAVEISKKYSTNESGSFVNGVLGGILRGELKRS